MHCGSCNGETPNDKPFCANCGVALAERCASCHAELITDKPFCATCGAAVGARTFVSATPPSEAVAERRLCSVLFVDLVGFTPFAETRDPEQVRELLTTYFERAQVIVDNYGGTVEKFIGDAVMAVWGAPSANEDDAERAVRAGLEIVSSVAQLGDETGLRDLRARGGVVTGEVAITIGRVSEGMVLGDTVNAASRVQGAASPGTVLVDEATWRAASGAIAFEEHGVLELKGKSLPVKAWRAMRVVAQRKGLGRSERLEPPFVGRDDELRLVKELLHATQREQRARLVSVTGTPGIGKSRLMWEFLKYVDGLADDVYWHQGRSRTYGEGVTFGALGEIVRMRAGILDSEDATSALEKLRVCLEEFVAEPEERRWIEPYLAHLLGYAEPPEGGREDLFAAWRTFFERIAAQGVTVLIFEDLQWADAGLIDFIESVLEWSRNAAIMVITLSRPELMDLRPSWGAGQRSFTSLHLEPLSEHAMRELLDGFVLGLSASVTDKVLARADGVPLYAVETIRMLFDRGMLVRDGEGYRLEGEIETLEMPETLHALIASRLDALAPAQRTLLQDAGVVGSSFSLESVLVVNGGERAQLEQNLHDLVRNEFLFTDNDPRSPERGQYGFVQGVIREVAVGMLARRDRSEKHLAIARYAESLEDDELVGAIAHHYLEASRAIPEDADSDLVTHQALAWMERAGERADSLGSPEQAIECFVECIDITHDDATRARLLKRCGDASAKLTDREISIDHYERAIALYDALGNLDEWGRAIAAVSGATSQLHGRAGVIERLEHAYARVGPDGDPGVLADLASRIANIEANSAAPELALPWCEVALNIGERRADDDLVHRALRARATGLFNLGRHREAVALGRGLIASADQLDKQDLQFVARSLLGNFLNNDDVHAAILVTTEAIELSRKVGHRDTEILNRLNLIEMLLLQGRLGEAATHLHNLRASGLPGWREEWLDELEGLHAALTGDPQRPGGHETIGGAPEEANSGALSSDTDQLMSLALTSLARGELDVAVESANRALVLQPTGINAGVSFGILVHAAVWSGDSVSLQDALSVTDDNRAGIVALHRLGAAAAFAALEGRLDESAELYREVIERWRSQDSILNLALYELDLVVALGVDHPEATVAKEARDIFTQIGAIPFLERLERVLSVVP